MKLEPYMTENFVISAFHKMGEQPQTVRLMRNKFTGDPAGYCFVNFLSDEQAVNAMHKLNGKPIPGTNPVVRFRLNSASNSNKLSGNEREFSVWVGDLSPEVDDYNLYRVFSNKYSSIKTAKVILDSSGFSKGYGFVRFGNEDEQKSALYEMNGFIGLGSKPLKICNAVPKPRSATTNEVATNMQTMGTTNTMTDFSQYYQDPSSWSLYGQQSATQAWPGYDTGMVADYTAYYAATAAAAAQQSDSTQASQVYNQQSEDLALVGKPVLMIFPMIN